jgi:hypothetical protein
VNFQSNEENESPDYHVSLKARHDVANFSDRLSTSIRALRCPICLVEYEEWEVLRQLPFCGHIFHTLCVGAWFEKQTTCPVCRMSMSELTESFGESLVAESIQMHCRRPPPSDVTVEVVNDNSAPSWITLNRRLPLPAPPVPATATEGTLPCTCPADVQVDPTCLQHADFHVVNIPQEEEWGHTGCKATKATKTVTFDNPETHQRSDVQILVFQTSIQKTGQNNEEESLTSQERAFTSGSNEFVFSKPTSDGAANSSKCDSNANDSSPTPADIKVQEDVQLEGSFEFQPVLTAGGGLTFRATTL